MKRIISTRFIKVLTLFPKPVFGISSHAGFSLHYAWVQFTYSSNDSHSGYKWIASVDNIIHTGRNALVKFTPSDNNDGRKDLPYPYHFIFNNSTL